MTDELIRRPVQHDRTPWVLQGVFAPVHGFCEHKVLLDDIVAGVCTEFHLGLDRPIVPVPYVILAHFEGKLTAGPADRHCTVIPFCFQRGIPNLRPESKLTAAVFVQVLKQKRLGIHVRATQDTLRGPPGFHEPEGPAALSRAKVRHALPGPPE